MASIYLNGTIEKKWRYTQTFDFISLKGSPLGQFLESSDSRRYHCIFKLFVSTQKSKA